MKPPCPKCPWRVGAAADAIPGFSMDLAEQLRPTCSGKFGAPIFACHHSREGDEFACSGWVARYGIDSIALRLAVAHGTFDADDLEPDTTGWPALYPTFDAMLENLRRTDR